MFGSGFARFQSAWRRGFSQGSSFFPRGKFNFNSKFGLKTTSLLVAASGLYAVSGLSNRSDTELDADFSCAKRKCEILDWKALGNLLPKESIPFTKDILVDTTPGPGADLVYPFVIIGDGLSAIAALDTLQRENQKTLVIGGPTKVRRKGEAWDDLEDRIKERVAGEKKNSDFVIGLDIKDLDAQNKLITLGDGRKVKFGKLLYANGAVLDALPDDLNQAKVLTFDDLEPLADVEKKIEQGKIHKVAVIGGGFVGTDAATTLAANHQNDKDVQVFQIFEEPAVLWNYLPPYMSNWLESKTEEVGVKVVPKASVVNIIPKDQRVELKLNDGRSIEVDEAIFMPTDVPPSTDVLAKAGLPIDPNNGAVAVDELFRANDDIFVAGDAASYPVFSGRIRKTDENFETSTGKVAAENMLGKGVIYQYDPPSSFRFHRLPFGGDLVGDVNSKYETAAFFQAADPKDKFERGAVFYLDKDKKVAGAIFVGFHSTERQRHIKRWMRTGKKVENWEYLRSALQPVHIRNAQAWHLPATEEKEARTDPSHQAFQPVS